jgi:hypothetical protein
MTVVTVVTSGPEVMPILRSLRMEGAPPSFHAARPPPQAELPFADAAPGFEPDPSARDDLGA